MYVLTCPGHIQMMCVFGPNEHSVELCFHFIGCKIGVGNAPPFGIFALKSTLLPVLKADSAV